jgi:hypothetical protein
MDERLVARLREIAEEGDRAEVFAVAVLPPESSLAGEMREGRVEFVKQYRGTHLVGYRVGRKLLVQPVERHRVRYSGRVVRGGAGIEGRWTIGGMGEGDPIRSTGEFLLERDGGSGESGG